MDEYQSLLNQAIDLERKFQGALDMPNDPMAQNARKQLQDLVSDAKTKRNPRDIESKLRGIQQQLNGMRARGGDVMDTQDLDQFYRTCEQMCMNVRKFQNY